MNNSYFFHKSYYPCFQFIKKYMKIKFSFFVFEQISVDDLSLCGSRKLSSKAKESTSNDTLKLLMGCSNISKLIQQNSLYFEPRFF